MFLKMIVSLVFLILLAWRWARPWHSVKMYFEIYFETCDILVGGLNKYQLLLLLILVIIIYSYGTLTVELCFVMDFLKYKQIMGYFKSLKHLY